MPYRLLRAVALGAPMLLATTYPSRARMVHDLGAIPGALHTPEALETFREQLAGTPSPDDLGSALSSGLSAPALAALLVSRNDAAPLGTVGAKPWPGMPGVFVALACTGRDGAGRKGPDGCSGSGDPPLHAYLAVIAIQADGHPTLVAPAIRVDPAVDWQGSLLPSSPKAVEDSDAGVGDAPSTYDRLDLAPYRIAPDTPAFGLRASWSDSYAGGFGWHSALILYAMIGGALRPVLSVPVLTLTDFAGDWNRDRTRQHDVEEGANVVVVTDHLAGGHFDILVRNRLTRRKRLFRWKEAAGAYRLIAR